MSEYDRKMREYLTTEPDYAKSFASAAKAGEEMAKEMNQKDKERLDKSLNIMTMELAQVRQENRRHRMIVWVREEDVMQMFLIATQKVGDVFPFPSVLGLPKGFELGAVQYNWEHQSFGFMIYHSSFEAVVDGCPTPYMTAHFDWEKRTFLKVVTEKDYLEARDKHLSPPDIVPSE